jgi:hypothetical protein
MPDFWSEILNRKCNTYSLNYCYNKNYHKILLTLRLQNLPIVTSSDKDQHSHPCHQIMVCTVCYSVVTYFRIFLKMINVFVQIKWWKSPFSKLCKITAWHGKNMARLVKQKIWQLKTALTLFIYIVTSNNSFNTIL